MKKIKTKIEPAPNKGFQRIEFETFREIGSYEVSNLTLSAPTACNGDVRVRRYKVTVEEIPELPEVIGQRIQDLWDTCDNHHHWQPLKAAAAGAGWMLIGDAGSKRKKS